MTATAEADPAPEAPTAPPPSFSTILVVDDSPVDRLVAGRIIEKHGGWGVSYAADGADALERIERSPPRAVLTDLQMPRVNGLALVRRVRERFPRVPVVIMTGYGSEEIAILALRAGAASYVPKRTLATNLNATLEQVLAAAWTDGRRDRVLGCQTRRSAWYTLESDPSLVGPLVSLLREDLTAAGLCDATGATRTGIALEEALTNAIYHGNLEVDAALRRTGDVAFFQQAAERRARAPYRTRRVRVVARLGGERAVYTVADDGPGFDPATLPDPADPSNMDRPHGRGVLLMRTFMDEVRYNAAGNRVTLVKRREARDH